MYRTYQKEEKNSLSNPLRSIKGNWVIHYPLILLLVDITI